MGYDLFMSLLTGFPAIAVLNAKVLILGSMPGVASLQAGQYYAHPRNQFWQILSAVLVDPPEPPLPLRSYGAREDFLKAHKIALWDVLSTCRREGSLDSAIRDEIVNDFSLFLQERPGLRHICLNGSKAALLFDRLVAPTLPPHIFRDLNLYRLPSTSPANAVCSLARKTEAWRVLKEALAL